MHQYKSNRWLDWAAEMRYWDFVANAHDFYLWESFVFGRAVCFWQNPTQPQKNCETRQINTNSLLAAAILLSTLVGQNIVRRCRGVLRLLGCARALQSARHVSRGLRDTHTPLPSGWLARERLPHYLYRQDYFNSLHYSTDGTCADKFHVFGLPGVTSVSLYLCTARKYCRADSE